MSILEQLRVLSHSDALSNDERSTVYAAIAHINELDRREQALMNALWKASGDDEEAVRGYLESQGYRT